MEMVNNSNEKKYGGLDQNHHQVHKTYNYHQPKLTLKRIGRRPSSLQKSRRSTLPICSRKTQCCIQSMKEYKNSDKKTDFWHSKAAQMNLESGPILET
ncbi:hypothetical protein DPMN_055598 [Dreissena polymorpha]|uniref:Uncharacterized protein n=1 Tax=Dreissena polymorpha TaxID=45954 RepID=A0A9D4CSN9_DREPO|nr:hypothetical protein DPMN_055598 [Dreissena polymorpha]